MRHNHLSAFLMACSVAVHAKATTSASGYVQDDSQSATAAESQPSEQRATAVSQPSSTQAERIRFNFKGATFEQVIDFFARVTGLPVIWQTPAPEGTLDYVSPDAYEVPEALRVLNLILQSRGVMLRVSNDHLYLQKLEHMQRENVPTFIGTIPQQITADQIVTVVRPLKIALCKPLADKLGSMVAAYGSVIAMEQQNALVMTETAANVRRLLSIVEQLDQEDPEGAVEIFRIRHAKAAALMIPLKALLSQRVEKFVINQQGQQVKIEEEQMPGLSIGADDRTNSIIAKGAHNKIEKLRQTIELLDIPGASGMGQDRSMTTMALVRIEPSEAVAKLQQLFQGLPEKERPTVIGMDDASKVMIIGSDSAVTEGGLLLRELENGPIGSTAGTLVEVMPLKHVSPEAVINATTSLLSKRQASGIKVIAGVDKKSIVVAGSADDVALLKSLLPMLDQESAGARQVRVVRIAAGDPLKILEQARQIIAASDFEFDLFDLFNHAPGESSATPTSDNQSSGNESRYAIRIALDQEARTVTLIGRPVDLDAFTATLRQLESAIIVERETRRFELANVLPSSMVGSLNAVAPQILLPRDGSQYVPPQFAAIDQLNVLIATGTPDQFTTLQPLIQSLDLAASAGTGSVHVLSIDNADATQIATNLDALFNVPGQPQPRPIIRVDAASNSLLVRASDEQVQTIRDLVSKIDRAAIASSRQMRMIAVDPTRADVEEVARTLQRMLQPDGSDSSKVQVISLEELLQKRQQAQSANSVVEEGGR